MLAYTLNYFTGKIMELAFLIYVNRHYGYCMRKKMSMRSSWGNIKWNISRKFDPYRSINSPHDRRTVVPTINKSPRNPPSAVPAQSSKAEYAAHNNNNKYENTALCDYFHLGLVEKANMGRYLFTMAKDSMEV